METNASDYALTTILSIINKNNEVHPVAFHSHTFTTAELNYDIYDKELLAIFEAFKIWRHYLEGPAYPIDVVMDHKNLEYFATTKVLTQRQARWSETFPSSILSSCFALIVSTQNRMLSLDDGTSILKGGILAMLQSTLTTSSPSLLKNNLQPPYKLLSFFFLLSVQLQLWIWTPYIKTSYWLSPVTQLLQNTSPQMAGGLQTQTVYSSLTTEFIYHLLVTSAHVFSSTIMITSLPDNLVKTKHWN